MSGIFLWGHFSTPWKPGSRNADTFEFYRAYISQIHQRILDFIHFLFENYCEPVNLKLKRKIAFLLGWRLSYSTYFRFWQKRKSFLNSRRLKSFHYGRLVKWQLFVRRPRFGKKHYFVELFKLSITICYHIDALERTCNKPNGVSRN